MNSRRRLIIKAVFYGFLIVHLAFGLTAEPDSGHMLGRLLAVPAALADTGKNEKNTAADSQNDKMATDSGNEDGTSAAEEMKSVLEALEGKRLQIQKQEEALKAEERRLERLKQEIEENIEKLTKIRKQVETDLARLEAKETEEEQLKKADEAAKLKQLVKAYSAMKPKKVAAIIDNLDIEIATKIFMNMKGEQVGKILSYMKSHQAAKISESLVVKQQKKKS